MRLRFDSRRDWRVFYRVVGDTVQVALIGRKRRWYRGTRWIRPLPNSSRKLVVRVCVSTL